MDSLGFDGIHSDSPGLWSHLDSWWNLLLHTDTCWKCHLHGRLCNAPMSRKPVKAMYAKHETCMKHAHQTRVKGNRNRNGTELDGVAHRDARGEEASLGLTWIHVNSIGFTCIPGPGGTRSLVVGTVVLPECATGSAIHGTCRVCIFWRSSLMA